MQREGVKPNVSTYNAVISACAQSECLTSACIAAFPPMSPLSAFRVMYWPVTTITCRRRVHCIIHQLAVSSVIHSSRRAWSQDVARSNRCRRGPCCVQLPCVRKLVRDRLDPCALWLRCVLRVSLRSTDAGVLYPCCRAAFVQWANGSRRRTCSRRCACEAASPTAAPLPRSSPRCRSAASGSTPCRPWTACRHALVELLHLPPPLAARLVFRTLLVLGGHSHTVLYVLMEHSSAHLTGTSCCLLRFIDGFKGTHKY